jgi:probable HAF family extracellular repeat protein
MSCISGFMVDLGSLGGSNTNSVATAVNSSGVIVGYSYTAGGTAFHAFAEINGTMKDLGTLGGTNSSALAINNAGTIVGWSDTATGSYHAFRYTNGKMSDLGTLGGTNSQAEGINNLGTIVGSSDLLNGFTHAFTFINGKMNDLGIINQFENYFYATSINDEDTIIGIASKDGVNPDFAFEYNTQVADTLGEQGSNGGSFSNPPVIDDYHDIVINSGYVPYLLSPDYPYSQFEKVTVASSTPATAVAVGTPLTLALNTATAAGYTYQWFLNNSPIKGATGGSYSLGSGTNKGAAATDAGFYSVQVTDQGSNVGVVCVGNLTVSPITAQPISQTINQGSMAVFSISATGSVTYQWQLNGLPLSDGAGIEGATGPQLTIGAATPANSGSYTCVVTTPTGSITSTSGVLTVINSSTPGSVISISSRAFVGAGDNILIGGFYIVGNTSRTVLVQAIGPALAAAPFNVTGTLQKPALTVHQYQNGKDTVLYSNTGWGSNPVLLAAAAAAYAQPVLQPNAADSEVLLTLPPGGYTAEVTGADGGTGVALCAIYQLP